MNALLSAYWKPVYKYIRLSWKLNNEDAKDMTQEFFISLMEHNSLDGVSPEKGRFRQFVKASLRNFMNKQFRDRSRIKRGGNLKKLSLDFNTEGIDVVSDTALSPDEVFLNEWVRTVVDLALERMERHLDSAGKSAQFKLFSEFYLAVNKPTHEELAKKFQIGVFDVGNWLKGLRAHYREAVIETIREYIPDRNAAEKECGELLKRLVYGSHA